MITNITEFVLDVISRVSQSEYGEYVDQGRIPRVIIVDQQLLENLPQNSLRELLSTYKEVGTLGLTIRYAEHETGIFSERNNTLELQEGDIVLFRNDNVTENQMLSALTHELMHSIFPGLGNDNDIDHGHDEACTDYLADFFYQHGNYVTNYRRIESNDGYMLFYNNFYKEYTDEQRRELLEKYVGKK